MKLHAFKMHLKPGAETEYRRRHDHLWPELAGLLREAGVSDYSIFLDPETLTLFAVMKLADNHRLGELPQHPVMRRWWDYMADLMVANPDRSPKVADLKQLFHLP